MPREGYKSITVPDDVYDYFWKEWLKNQKELRTRGVRSFSGFVTMLLREMLELREKEKKGGS